MEEHPILNENERLAMRMAGESTTRVMTLDGKTADDIIKENNINNFNSQVDKYVDKFNEHTKKLEEYTDEISKNAEKIEIMPIGNYVLAKPFSENPFQRIVKKGNIIIDTGGLAPEYKNTDNGEWEEEEQFIKVLVVVEVGPECKWVKPEDVIFATKPSLVPVPFYKQNLQLVCENRVLSIVNEGLSERFKNNDK